jgi:hypothetical protein
MYQLHWIKATLFYDLTRDSKANNFVIGFYRKCLEILCQIVFSSLANYFRSYRILQFGIKSVGIYSTVEVNNEAVSCTGIP